jgi:pimeloyl-ACP methyl ester carboxylesterase
MTHITRSALACLLVAAGFAPAQDPAAPATAKAADGVSIAYETRGRGDTALVFVHGWSCNRSFWKEQLGEFAKDYRVVALDLGGHGRSGTNRQRWTIDGLAGDVEAVVKALDLKRVVLVGHSMGGPVSLFAARRLPGTVIGVVAVDTLHNAEYKWPEGTADQMADRFAADFPKAMREFIAVMFPPDAKKELGEWVVEQTGAAHRPAAIALMRGFATMDLKAALAGAKVPVRCVNATPKLQFSIPTAVEVNKKYADFGAVEMDGVGHFPMLERPAEFNRKLRDVVKEIEALKK